MMALRAGSSTPHHNPNTRTQQTQNTTQHRLVTPAWMLANYGYVCRTGGPDGHEVLTEDAKAQVSLGLDLRLQNLGFS